MRLQYSIFIESQTMPVENSTLNSQETPDRRK